MDTAGRPVLSFTMSVRVSELEAEASSDLLIPLAAGAPPPKDELREPLNGPPRGAPKLDELTDSGEGFGVLTESGEGPLVPGGGIRGIGGPLLTAGIGGGPLLTAGIGGGLDALKLPKFDWGRGGCAVGGKDA